MTAERNSRLVHEADFSTATAGMPPSLLERLCTFDSASIADAELSLQVFSFGYRAVLEAYGMAEQTDDETWSFTEDGVRFIDHLSATQARKASQRIRDLANA